MSVEENQPTTTRTFRIPEKLFRSVEEEAREKRTSLNAMLNEILYDRYFEDVPHMAPGSLAVSALLFSEMISRLSDEDVKRIGRLTAEGDAKTVILIKHGEISTEGIIELMRDTTVRAGYGKFYEKQEGKRIITLMHALGPKASLFFSAEFEALFQMIGLRPTITRSDTAMVVEI